MCKYMARIRTVMCFSVQHAILWWIFQKLRGANILEDQSIWSAKHELTFEKKSKNFLYQYIFSFVDVAYKCYWSHIRFFFAFCLVFSEEMRIFPGLEVFHVLPAPLYTASNAFWKYDNYYMGFSSFSSKLLSYSMKQNTKEIIIFIFRN